MKDRFLNADVFDRAVVRFVFLPFISLSAGAAGSVVYETGVTYLKRSHIYDGAELMTLATVCVVAAGYSASLSVFGPKKFNDELLAMIKYPRR